MTPDRYGLALAAFHLGVLAATAWVAWGWRKPAVCRRSVRPWIFGLGRELGILAVFAYATSLAAPFLANLDHPKRLQIGEISGRLMGQALFGEAIALGLALAFWHRRAAANRRALTFAGGALALCLVYAQAYRLEPRQLVVSRHVVDQGGAESLRILHITDIQTPRIGEHEERALRTGMAQRPDLVVLTGDYVQDELGRPTEAEAARDLRRLLVRVGFRAPLGIFATEGDVGPQCREVFAGTEARCLTDESAVVTLAGGATLKITGLSRGRGRERSPAVLAGLLERGPRADHQIVISHSPDFVDALPWKLDLALAGHTHGGQFVLPFFGPLVTASRLPRRYAAGLHDFRGVPLHVSRGVGMERGFAPPVRFLCPPEVCLLDVRLVRGGAMVAARLE
jgi:predicted MPP superfamily phosphohydrolase